LVFAKKLVFFGDAGVDVAASSSMQSSQEGFPYREGKEMGRGCLPGSCLSLLVFDLCRPLKEA
jgi:hypothetical protein